MSTTVGTSAADDTQPIASTTARPLVVDLDGTLIKTDLLVESFLSLVSKSPLNAIGALMALFKGKAALKARLADQAVLDMATMPLNPAVCDVIAARRASGAEIAIASASDLRYVSALANQLGGFDRVFGTEKGENLSGRKKAERLVEFYGERSFDYIGNERVDLHIWEKAQTAYLAGGSSDLARRLRQRHDDVVVLEQPSQGLRPYLKALRPHQWLKNILVFAPAAAAHTVLSNLGVLTLAFIAFSMCASSVYIFNDLLDLAADRDHPRKRNRPFASGAASAKVGVALAVALLIGAIAISLVLPIKFLITLAIYYVLTSAYSLSIKRKPIVDVITLACLYGMRVWAGGYASNTNLSQWLEALAIFLFLSLALVKRCAELVARAQLGKSEMAGRGYRLDDLNLLESMAVASGFISALVLALYVNSVGQSPDGFSYAHPRRLWLLCILLLAWISRVLLITRRGEMTDDPIVFAVRDKWSLVVGLACAAVVGSATI